MRKNRIALSVILALATFIAALAWGGLKNFLFNQGNWIWPILAFWILFIFLSLGWLLLKSKVVLFVTLAIALSSFFIVFGFNLIYLIAILVGFSMFCYGSLRAINEKEARIKLKISRVLKAGLPWLLTGLSMIIAVVYFHSPMSLNQQEQIEIPRAFFDVVINPATDFISQNLYKGSDTASPKNIQFDNVPAEIRPLIEILLGKQGLEKRKDVDEAVEDTIYQTLIQEVNRLFKDYKKYIAISLSISLFLILKFASAFFMWLIILFAWLILKMLVYFEAIHIQEKAVLKEVIET